MKPAHVLTACLVAVAVDAVTTHVRVARFERRLDVQRAPVPDARVDELVVNANELGRGLELERDRSTWFYAVLDTFLHEAACWDLKRTRLPTPPQGWAALEIQTEPKSWRRLTASAGPVISTRHPAVDTLAPRR